MCRAAGAGDDDLEARGLGALGEGESRSGVRCAETIRASCDDAERRQGLGGMAHRVPVGLASHDDGDGGCHSESLNKRAEKEGGL